MQKFKVFLTEEINKDNSDFDKVLFAKTIQDGNVSYRFVLKDKEYNFNYFENCLIEAFSGIEKSQVIFYLIANKLFELGYRKFIIVNEFIVNENLIINEVNLINPKEDSVVIPVQNDSRNLNFFSLIIYVNSGHFFNNYKKKLIYENNFNFKSYINSLISSNKLLTIEVNIINPEILSNRENVLYSLDLISILIWNSFSSKFNTKSSLPYLSKLYQDLIHDKKDRLIENRSIVNFKINQFKEVIYRNFILEKGFDVSNVDFLNWQSEIDRYGLNLDKISYLAYLLREDLQKNFKQGTPFLRNKLQRWINEYGIKEYDLI